MQVFIFSLDLAGILAASGTQENLMEAEKLYKTVLQMRPDYMPAYERRGEIMFKLSRLNDAREMFQTGLQYNPNNGNCYYNLAVIELTEGPRDPKKLTKAFSYLDRAIQLEPEHYHAMHAFA